MITEEKTKTSGLWDKVVHRWFRVPYSLYATEVRVPKKPRATIVLIHGIGNSSETWDDLLPLLLKNVRVISVDLLGFGQSPKPSWVKYNAKTQARSVAATVVRMGLKQQPIIVGHSLGALVAVETAKRYPFTIKHLILCSPPFYAPEAKEGGLLKRDKMLRELYRMTLRHPKEMQKLSSLAVRLNLANKTLDLSDNYIDSYIATLETSIINQTSLRDVGRLRLPITILYGALDPVVIGSHIQTLAKQRQNIVAKRLVAGHEVVGTYAKKLAEVITELLDSKASNVPRKL